MAFGQKLSFLIAFFCLAAFTCSSNAAVYYNKRAKFAGQDLDAQFCGIRAREQAQWLDITQCGSKTGSALTQCRAAFAKVRTRLHQACQTYEYKYNMYVSRQTPVNLLGVDGPEIVNSTSYDNAGRAPINATNFLKINYVNQTIQGYKSGYKYRVHNWVGPYTIEYNGATYEMAGWHFHKPSEHTFDGVNSQMEIHFVHVMVEGSYLNLQRDQDKYLVLGFMIDDFANVATPNPTCASLNYGPFDSSISGESNVEVTITKDMVSRIFTYSGGLTTPPFTARVRWCLSAYPIKGDATAIDDWGNQPINPDYKNTYLINEGGFHPSLNANKKLRWKAFGHYPLSTRSAFPHRAPVRQLYQDITLLQPFGEIDELISNGCPVRP